MKSYAKFAIAAALIAFLPSTGALAAELPANVQAQVQAVKANPSDATAQANLVDALEEYIRATGLENVEDIASELVGSAQSGNVAAIFAESVATAAINVAATTPGADVAAVARAVGTGIANANSSPAVIQAAASGARSAAIANGISSVVVVDAVTGGASDVTTDPVIVQPPQPVVVDNPAIDISPE